MRLFTSLLLCLSASAGALAQSPKGSALERARRAWDTGDYPTALQQLQKLLASPQGAKHKRAIALLTGELHPVREITPDGRSIQIASDGQHVSYQLPRSRRDRKPPTVRVVESASGTLVAERQCAESRFSRDGSTIAFRNPDGAVTTLSLRTRREHRTAQGAPEATRLVPMGSAGFGYEGKSGETNAIYQLIPDAGSTLTTHSLTSTQDYKSDTVVDPSARYLVYRSAKEPPRRGRGRFRRFRGPAIDAEFLVQDRFGAQANRRHTLRGGQPIFSADGATMAFLAPGATGETTICTVAMPTDRGKDWRPEPRVVFRTTNAIQAFDLAPDGKTIVFQMRPEYDWELYTIATKGGQPRRLTREIQNDLSPQFLDNQTVMAVMGEPRHRRAYVYDLTTGHRMRLFHNNTIRTIAPQYEWRASRSGQRVLIQSERDGNTVTPDRGVYLVDRSREVTIPELMARLQSQHAAETALRQRGATTFGPIHAAVTEITRSIDPKKIEGYQKELAACGSRHITRPGNKLAADYLMRTLRSFGYEPVRQKIAGRGSRRSIMGAGGSANVIATLRGTVHPELVYVLGSHYDSVSRGPGADDNASGTAVTLEAARVLAKHPQPATIVFVCFTGEESGLLGSRDYVRRAVKDGMQVVGALNNDMLGWANDHRIDNTIRYSNPGIRDVQHNAAMRYSKLITYDALYYKGTDAHAFYDGWGDIVGGIGSYPVLGNPHYHRATDQIPTINQAQVTATARATTATLMALAASPSRVTDLRIEKVDGKHVAKWSKSPERDVDGYELYYGPEDAPRKHRVLTDEPGIPLRHAQPGDRVSVRAINKRDLFSWDAVRTTVGK